MPPPVAGLALSESPKIQRRILDHWDNLDGTIERGYAGKSLWNGARCPATSSQRYTDYARANASIGINGVVLNNVNANAQILTAAYLAKVAALATAFRPYGIARLPVGAVRRAARRSAASPPPIRSNSAVSLVGGPGTQSHEDPRLRRVPGEGQLRRAAGAADYGRTHADGANMLAARAGAAQRHRHVARLRLRRRRHRSHRPGVRRVQAARRQVRAGNVWSR